LRRVIDALERGEFSRGDSERYRPLVQSLLQRDPYMLMADYASYVATQAEVDTLYAQPKAWAERTIHNIAAMGEFSADRTVSQYINQVWAAPQR
jgi:glycogen phosphorylase